MTDPSHGAATDVGRRETNQDYFIVQPPLYAVADGMGGHRAGDVASRTAVEVISEKIRDQHEALAEAVREANRAVHDKAGSDPKLRDMGTTMTAVILQDGRAQLVHVGDSRAYLFRAGELERLTEDHSVVGRMVREGRISAEEADQHPQRSVLEKALGVEAELDVDSHTVGTEPGDRILLCSDGLTNVLADEEIQAILADEPNPEKAAKRLVGEAIKGGANDNVTTVVVNLPGEPVPATARPLKKRRKGRVIAAAVLVAVLALLVGGRAVLVAPWWVGEDRGNVVIFKGVEGSFAGVKFVRVVERSEVEVATLPEAVADDIKEGIPAEDRMDAEQIVRNFKRQFGDSA